MPLSASNSSYFLCLTMPPSGQWWIKSTFLIRRERARACEDSGAGRQLRRASMRGGRHVRACHPSHGSSTTTSRVACTRHRRSAPGRRGNRGWRGVGTSSTRLRPQLDPGGFMRIAVTGGTGKLGRHVVRRLTDSGHTVVNLDREGERADGFVRVDLTDYGQVIDALSGARDGDQPRAVDAIVHLAAVPAPGLSPDIETFRNNIVTTFG